MPETVVAPERSQVHRNGTSLRDEEQLQRPGGEGQKETALAERAGSGMAPLSRTEGFAMAPSVERRTSQVIHPNHTDGLEMHGQVTEQEDESEPDQTPSPPETEALPAPPPEDDANPNGGGDDASTNNGSDPNDSGDIASSTSRDPNASSRSTSTTTDADPNAVSPDTTSSHTTSESQTSPNPTQADSVVPSTQSPNGTGSSGTDAVSPNGGDTGASGGEGGPQGGEGVPDQPLETGDSSSMIRSITGMNAVSFANGMERASEAAKGLQNKEKKEQQDGLPEIDQPTGVPTRKQKEAEALALKNDQAPDLKPEGNAEGHTIETQHESPSGPVPGSQGQRFSEPTESQGEDDGSWWSRLFNRIRSFLSSLPEGDSGVSTSAGERPKVDLSGQADPKQNEEHQTTSTKKVDENLTNADQETTKDFGEKDIYPDIETEKMAPKIELMGAEPREGKNLGKREISGDVKQALNTNLQSRMDEKVSPKNQEFEEAHQTYEADSEKEKTEGLAKIDEETARVKAEQESEQTGAASQVEAERTKWKADNEQVKKTYDKQSAEKKKEIDKQIDTKVKSSEDEAKTKLDNAEKEAKREKKKAEDEAKRKKREAESKPRSFWDRVKGAISDLCNKIRAAINTIFDALRKLVKGIIELAKKAVKGIIELARKAIVGLIKAFGEALKAFVSIALAAFPELAKKARAAIDRTVDSAVKAVNKAAQALKDFADKVLDAIGKALDFILSVYQRVYNAIIDALEFIAVGIIEIIEGIANLVQAARQMPDHFWSQVSVELTGQDLTKPLPGIERTTPPVAPGASPGSASAANLDPASTALLSKNQLSAEDVVIDPVPEMDIDKELFIDAASHGDGELMFGNEEAGDLTLEEIRAMSGFDATAAAAGGSMPGGATADASGGGAGGPDFANMTDSQKMDYYLAQMNPQCNDMAGPAPTGETDNSIPDVAKVGPLSVGQRAGFVLSQVKKGIANWWECNKVMIISIMVGALLGLAVAAFFTGGAAILAAIQALMSALTVIFGAILVAKMGYHIGQYVKKAWSGDIVGGAQSLARAIAVGLVELVFNFLFKVGGLLLKVVKQVAKAIAKAAKAAGKLALKAGKATVQGLKVAGKAAFKFTRRIATPLIKQGKVFLKGIGRGFARGVKKVKDFGKKLKNHFGFKGFSLQIRGKRFYLYGYFNPKKLLATGEVKNLTKAEEKALQKMGGNKQLVGKSIGSGAKKGIVVSDRYAAKKLKDMTPGERAAAFKELEKKTADQIRRLGGGGKSTKELRKGIPHPHPTNFQAHHVVPEEIMKNPVLKKFLDRIGFKFQDGAKNGVLLPPNAASQTGAWKNATIHMGSHPNYTKTIETMIERARVAFERSSKGLTGNALKQAKQTALANLHAQVDAVRKGLMNGTVRLH
ncbi:MAG: AHH domain-containing protein [Flavobacteriales bacterium]|nr:AHH domain-containing protein [Flavobacteriales bacterium]